MMMEGRRHWGVVRELHMASGSGRTSMWGVGLKGSKDG
jgi:hypothetical protein